jgi:class 3 adenylate cyclase
MGIRYPLTRCLIVAPIATGVEGMAELPSGTVTFLLTDVEGSTALWETAPGAMRPALVRHDVLFEAAVAEHGGVHIRPRGEGDSRFAVFASATDAAAAAVSIQRAFAAEGWPTPRPIKVRIGVHTGEAELRDGDYYGSAVNRCARLRGLGHGGQVLLSEATEALVRDALPVGALVRDLGVHRLRDVTQPERVYQLSAPDLPQSSRRSRRRISARTTCRSTAAR